MEVDYAITHLPADPPNVATDPYPARTLYFAWPHSSSTTSLTMGPEWDLHNRTRYAPQTGRDTASPKMLTPLLTFQMLISLLLNNLSLLVALPSEQLASAQHEVDYAITHLPADPPNVATDPYPARTLYFAWPHSSSTTSLTMGPEWDLHNRTRYAPQTGLDTASPKMLTPLLTFQMLISLLLNNLSLLVALPSEQLASAQHEVDYAISHLPADPPNVATDQYPARTLYFAWPHSSSTTSLTMGPEWDLHNRTRYAPQTGRDIASPKMLTPLLTFQV
ncbi:hypothetical protein MTO96_032626 [Rhipicephalus appendiculatus]